MDVIPIFKKFLLGNCSYCTELCLYYFHMKKKRCKVRFCFVYVLKIQSGTRAQKIHQLCRFLHIDSKNANCDTGDMFCAFKYFSIIDNFSINKIYQYAQWLYKQQIPDDTVGKLQILLESYRYYWKVADIIGKLQISLESCR